MKIKCFCLNKFDFVGGYAKIMENKTITLKFFRNAEKFPNDMTVMQYHIEHNVSLGNLMPETFQ